AEAAADYGLVTAQRRVCKAEARTKEVFRMVKPAVRSRRHRGHKGAVAIRYSAQLVGRHRPRTHQPVNDKALVKTGAGGNVGVLADRSRASFEEAGIEVHHIVALDVGGPDVHIANAVLKIQFAGDLPAVTGIAFDVIE